MTQSKPHTTRGTILAVTSGKGGVGKTNVVINLAAALARFGHRVGIIDADFGLGNIDVLLGLTPEYHVGHVLTGEKSISDITLQGPLGVKIVPAGSGIRELTALNAVQWRRFQKIIQTVGAELDFLLIDTAAGISDNVVDLLQLAERVLVVTSYDPAAIVDAYTMIKILTTTAAKKDIGVVVNATRDADEAGLVFRQLDIAATKFLERSLRFDGYIVADPGVREAVLGQRPIVDHLPQAPASRCFRILASRLAGFTPDGGASRQAGSPPYVMSAPKLSLEATRCA